MTVKQITSKSNISGIAIMILGIIGSSLAGGVLIKNALFSDEYIGIPSLILGGALATFAFYCFSFLITLKTFVIENKTLTFYSLLRMQRKTIPLRDIESYMEVEQKYEHSTWLKLILFTKDSKFEIHSSMYSNYKPLRKVLIKGKKENLYAKKLWCYERNRREGFGFFIAGLLFILLFGKIFILENSVILREQLSTIEGTILNELKIEYSGKKKVRRTKYIKIELEEYPSFRFEIGKDQLKVTRANDLILNVEAGEKLKLDILTDQLRKKLNKEDPLSLIDSGFNYRLIRVYGLRDQDQSYFDLGLFNKQREENQSPFALFFLFGFSVFMLGYGLYTLRTNKRPVTFT